MKLIVARALMLIFGFSYIGGETKNIIVQNHSKMAVNGKHTTFILLRHAEKDGIGNNPELSPDGLARAEALRRTLQNVKIDAIYSTPYNRTRKTVEALASDKKILINEYDANTFPSRLINEILTTNKGKTVLIVGHSNTIPAIIKTLDKTTAVTISETQYDNLYIVDHFGESETRVLKLKYGKPTD